MAKFFKARNKKIISYDYETSIQLVLTPVIDFDSVEHVFVLDTTASYEELVQ